MKGKKYLYSSGEFARLNGVNKRTLHYYNDIGLFTPAVVGENGYHYYTSFQIVQLELILTLRRIGLSVEDVRRYLHGPSDGSLSRIMAEKKQLIDRSIDQLLAVKAFLEKKSDKLKLGMSAEHGKVELIHMPQRRVLLSAPITGRYDKEDFSVAAEFSLRLKGLFGLYDNFGSRLSTAHIAQGDFQRYDCFFAYGREDVPVWDALLPEGSCLRAFSTGGWDRLPEVYARVLDFARAHRLALLDFAYEEGLNEMFIQDMDSYVTMITIPCREEGSP